jgi:hypothetical protein
MNSVTIGISAFVAIFGGALSGVWLARCLPEPHLSAESRTVVSLSMAVVGTLSALVLGLLISTASTSFGARTNAIEDLAIDIIKLNRALVRYGPEASNIRSALQDYAQQKALELSGQNGKADLGLDTLRMLETVTDQIVELHATDDRQRQVQARALRLTYAMADARWLLVEKAGVTMPLPLLVLLIFWLALLFASFGLFAPRNATVIVVLLSCSLAISGGIWMILELGAPTHGFIRSSTAPMQVSIGEIGGN